MKALFLLLLCIHLIAAASFSQEDAVAMGMRRMRQLCDRQRKRMRELLRALKKKDPQRSRNAYKNARPAYEQIEALREAFPELHIAIDARPDEFECGEDDSKFEGFHFIERELFREQSANTPVLRYTQRLRNDVRELCTILKDDSLFTPQLVLRGIERLAYEVASKKISSEEETWSDATLVIMRNNIQGIFALVRPFFQIDIIKRSKKARVRNMYNAIKKVFNTIDTTTSFSSTKGKSRKYSTLTDSERIRLQKYAYAFAEAITELRIEAIGDGMVPDPSTGPEGGMIPDSSAEPEESKTPVSIGKQKNGAAIPSSLYTEQVQEGLRNMMRQCRRLLDMTEIMIESVKSNKLNRVRGNYPVWRSAFEQMEVLGREYESLKLRLDGRPYMYEMGERSMDWRGMHEVERAIFRDKDLGVAKASLKMLEMDVNSLCNVIKDGIDGHDSFSAESSFSGMIGLAYEIPARKISSEEETWSDLTLMVMRENLKGIWSQFTPFKDVLPGVVFNATKSEYSYLRTLFTFTLDFDNDYSSGYNFRPYSSLFRDDKRMLHFAFMRFARTLVEAHKALLPSVVAPSTDDSV